LLRGKKIFFLLLGRGDEGMLGAREKGFFFQRKGDTMMGKGRKEDLTYRSGWPSQKLMMGIVMPGIRP